MGASLTRSKLTSESVVLYGKIERRTSENFWDLIKPGAGDVRAEPAGIVSQMI